MACIITYKNNKYSQQEFEKYFENNFNEFVSEFLSQDIEGFKNYLNKDVSLPEDYTKAQEIDPSITPEAWNTLTEEEKKNWFKCNKK